MALSGLIIFLRAHCVICFYYNLPLQIFLSTASLPCKNSLYPYQQQDVANSFLLFQLHTHEVVEVCTKILYQVELSRNTLEQMWGFSVEAELVENADRQDELCCYVSRVEDKSVAMQNGKSLRFQLNTCCNRNKWICSF